jgi:hypothetical protein
LSIRTLSLAALLLVLPALAAAPASAAVALCTVSTTAGYALDEGGATLVFTGYQVADTAVFADESAEPTGLFAGETTKNSLNYAADLLRGSYLPGTSTFASAESADAITYAAQQTPPTLKYTFATVDNGVYLAGETAAYTVPYALQLPGCVLSDVQPILADILQPMTLA